MPPFIFSGSMQRPADLSAENRWRSCTYLQYINGVPEDAHRWSLSFVQCCRFGWRQPLGLELFEGRVASLGIDRLGLDAESVTALLSAIAGQGAKAPITSLRLRVARPWLALFEEARGDELPLPANWLEGLELHGEPLSLWIGNRVLDNPICPNLLDPSSESVRQARKRYADLDWSLYESTRFGWKLHHSSPLPSSFYP
jgi:hypothetical protein